MYPRQDIEADFVAERLPNLPVSAFIATIVDLMPVVRLGGRAEAGVLVLTTDDKTWFEAFLRLADDARAILIVPGPGVSLAREMGHVFETHSEKCIVLQPPISVITENEARDLLKNRFPTEFWEKYGWHVANVPQSSRISAWRELSLFVRDTTGLEVPAHVAAGRTPATRQQRVAVVSLLEDRVRGCGPANSSDASWSLEQPEGVADWCPTRTHPGARTEEWTAHRGELAARDLSRSP